MKSITAVVIGVALICSQSFAQQPAFEVASVRPSNGPAGGWQFPPSGGFTAQGVDLYTLVVTAFEIPLPLMKVKLVWPPEALKRILTTRFDIQAKGQGDQRALLRTLLVERFGLRSHTETRQMPVYAIVVKEPGRLGRWLRPSNVNCRELFATGKLKEARDVIPECAFTWEQRNGARIERWAGTMRDLSEKAQQFSARPVVDATGLSGNHAWELAFTVSGAREELEAKLRDAFEDQLGLKLEPRMGPYEVLVIDDVRMPTPN